MIPAALRYHRATSLEDALQALAAPGARALAGGQSLLPVMKLRVARPELVVDIGRLELTGLEPTADTMRIGALTTWQELARDLSLSTPALAAIPECASRIGDLQVRNRGTIGGSLVHADPASDMPAVLLALSAVLEVRSRDGERELPVSELFVGPFLTALAPGELVTTVIVPAPPPDAGSAYVAVEHPASGFPLAGAAALVHADGRSVVAVTGVSSRPLLLDHGVDHGASLDAVEILGDRFAPAEYRRELAEVVVGRALGRALERAGGGTS